MSTTYGVVAQNVDNDLEVTALKQAGVKDKSYIYHVQHLGELIEKVEEGDKIVVVSVDRLTSVGVVYQVFGYLQEKRVSFKSIMEGYLDFGDSKMLKTSTIKLICKVAQDEQGVINSFYNYYKYSTKDVYMEQQIRKLCVRSLKRIFAGDGILKRKN